MNIFKSNVKSTLLLSLALFCTAGVNAGETTTKITYSEDGKKVAEVKQQSIEIRETETGHTTRTIRIPPMHQDNVQSIEFRNVEKKYPEKLVVHLKEVIPSSRKPNKERKFNITPNKERHSNITLPNQTSYNYKRFIALGTGAIACGLIYKNRHQILRKLAPFARQALSTFSRLRTTFSRLRTQYTRA